MNDASGSFPRMPKPLRCHQRKSRRALLWLVLPLAALGLAIAWLLITDPLRGLGNGAPPVENLTFERTILFIRRASGSSFAPRARTR